jgi:predicted TIM-barrel fold metal-dependent hydrolase
MEKKTGRSEYEEIIRPENFINHVIWILILFGSMLFTVTEAQVQIIESPSGGYRTRIRNYIDSLGIVDTHEHLFNPDLLKQSSLLDFMLLFQMHNFNDMVSAGMSPRLLLPLMGDSLTPVQKWNLIKPYWEISANTGFNRVSLLAASELFGIDDLNDNTVLSLSEKIKDAYKGDWFDYIVINKCKIKYIIQDGEYIGPKYKYIKYARRFNSWLTIDSRYNIDSLSVAQVYPINILEDLVKSMELAFDDAYKRGMIAVKVSVAYSRTLRFENVNMDAARRAFRAIMDSDEDEKLDFAKVKPLQDYMLHRLIELADKYNIPVAFHTGLHASNGNYITNSDPTLLTNLFFKYPDVNFSIFHGSYPFGGELATLAKNFPNVYIDMCWLYAISPSYSERYLNEWIETVPASKIMAFGGDYNNVENIYSELILAKQIITRVLTDKVRERYMSERRAKLVARLILYDNAMRFYNLKPY